MVNVCCSRRTTLASSQGSHFENVANRVCVGIFHSPESINHVTNDDVSREGGSPAPRMSNIISNWVEVVEGSRSNFDIISFIVFIVNKEETHRS